jgi:hypothetical protein
MVTGAQARRRFGVWTAKTHQNFRAVESVMIHAGLSFCIVALLGIGSGRQCQVEAFLYRAFTIHFWK